MSDPRGGFFPPIFTERAEREEIKESKDWRKLGEEARSEDREIDLILFPPSSQT